MANAKGNQYPMWYVDNNQQVWAIGKGGVGDKHQMSKAEFAFDLGISEDGTVWALSTESDPDGGGLKVYWSNGDGNWTEINTSDPGGIIISGGPGSSCIFLTASDEVYSMDTNGSTKLLFQNQGIVEINYGGGYYWAVLPEHTGRTPVLRFMKVGDSSWTTFSGNITPYSISVNYQGNCAAVENFSPMVYQNDGTTSYSAGQGADGQALQISFRNWCFLINTDVNENGNQIMEWQDDQGGTFMVTGARGNRVESSYYRAG